MAVKRSFRILQCNVQRSYGSMHELVTYFLHHKFTACLITEPYTGRKNIVRDHPEIDVFQFPAATCPSTVKACLLLRKDAAEGIGLSQLSTPNLAVVQVALEQRILLLASAYIEPEVDTNNTIPALQNLLAASCGRHIIIAADCNGHHPLWGCEQVCPRGEQVASLAASCDLSFCNEGRTPTFEVSRNQNPVQSIVDVTLASAGIVNRIGRWQVDLDACPSSDHNAISFEIDTPADAPARDSTYLYNNKIADWNLFKSCLREEMDIACLTEGKVNAAGEGELEDIVSCLTAIIQKACSRSMKLRGTGRKYNPWWTPALEEMKKEVIRLHHHLHKLKSRNHDLSAAAKLHQEKRIEYAKALKKAAGENFRSFCQRQGKEDAFSTVTRMIKDAPARKAPATLKLPNSQEFTTNGQETAEALLRHMYPDDDKNDTQEQEAMRQAMQEVPDTKDEPAFTAGEVQEELASMCPNRAPGNDHLTSDICIAFAQEYPALLPAIFNRCLLISYFPKAWKVAEVKILPKPGKEDYSDLSSYRPIGLLPVFGKLLEKLFVKRITFLAMQEGKWSSRQYGFRAQVSTSDALHKIISKVKASCRRKQVIGVSLDIKAAFDNAWWPLLLHQLRATACPANIFKLICSYIEDRQVNVTYAGACASKSMTKGCIQGSVCGPTFWNLVLEQLLRIELPAGCYIQAFADDVFLLVEGDTAPAAINLAKQALSIIEKWGRSVKLTFSPAKTQAIAFTQAVRQMAKAKEAGTPFCGITMGGVEVPAVPAIKLLGVTIDDKLSFTTHARQVIKKASCLFKKLCTFVRPTWGLQPAIVEIIYRQVIEPMITYAAGIWGGACQFASVRNCLRSFQRSFAIKAIRAFHTVSAVSALALAQFLPLHLKVKQVWEVEQAKLAGTAEQYLPTDIELERRVPIGGLLHPAERFSIAFHKVNTQEEADAIASACCIYTDGSKHKDGTTGCAYVAYLPEGKKVTRKFSLHSSCTVFQAELLAIDRACEWLVKRKVPACTIYTDSLSSLLAIQQRSNPHPLVNRIHHLLMQLKHTCLLTFSWVKAHKGIAGNEEADAAANAARTSRSSKTYDAFPISFVKHQAKQQAMRAWQEEYEQAPQGSTTKRFLPTIKAIGKMKELLPLDFALTQVLTGHGFHLSYLHRFKIAPADQCPCGEGTQDIDHLLTECPRYMHSRHEHESLCSERQVPAFDPCALTKHQDLLHSFSSFINDIIRTLKSFNTMLC